MDPVRLKVRARKLVQSSFCHILLIKTVTESFQVEGEDTVNTHFTREVSRMLPSLICYSFCRRETSILTGMNITFMLGRNNILYSKQLQLHRVSFLNNASFVRISLTKYQIQSYIILIEYIYLLSYL